MTANLLASLVFLAGMQISEAIEPDVLEFVSELPGSPQDHPAIEVTLGEGVIIPLRNPSSDSEEVCGYFGRHGERPCFALEEIQTVGPRMDDFERAIGFVLPEGLLFRDDDPARTSNCVARVANCPDRDQRDYRGSIVTAEFDLEARHRFQDALLGHGWAAESGPLAGPEISWRQTEVVAGRDCTRVLELDHRYVARIGITLHIYPCESAQ